MEGVAAVEVVEANEGAVASVTWSAIIATNMDTLHATAEVAEVDMVVVVVVVAEDDLALDLDPDHQDDHEDPPQDHEAGPPSDPDEIDRWHHDDHTPPLKDQFQGADQDLVLTTLTILEVQAPIEKLNHINTVHLRQPK